MTSLYRPFPNDWEQILAEQRALPYFSKLDTFVTDERQHHSVFPPAPQVFNALTYTPYSEVKVVLLGQDPYHGDGQAHGLAFSVPEGVTPPPSLRNIFKELASDLDRSVPTQGSLIPWTGQGVLLLNTVLTVRAHQPNSHRGQGWETLTDAVIRSLDRHPQPLFFLLWGSPAQKKALLIDGKRHRILQAPHPSPLSAHRGFLGSRPFSKVDAQLEKWGRVPIDWSRGLNAESG